MDRSRTLGWLPGVAAKLHQHPSGALDSAFFPCRSRTPRPVFAMPPPRRHPINSGKEVDFVLARSPRALEQLGLKPMRIRVLGIVLAGGKGTRLAPLTNERAKPAVPFGGKYRIIDLDRKS